MSVRWKATILFAWALFGCDEMDGVARDGDGGVDAYVAPLLLNHIQMRGTVNSYHDYPEGLGEWGEDNGIAEVLRGVRYRHLPFDEQATLQGIRQFDLDLLGDPTSGTGFQLLADLRESFGDSICRTFYRCLETLRDWSDANPRHAPLVLLIGETLNSDDREFGHVEHQLDDLESAVEGILGRERLVTPGDVRGEHPDLMTALAAQGWPPVEALRGRVMVVLNQRGIVRERYLERAWADVQTWRFIGEEQYLFVIGDPAEESPDEVVFTFESVDDATLPSIERLVGRGFLVHASTDDAAMMQRVRAAGAHMVATRVPAHLFGPLDEGTVLCNPVTAPAHCTADRLEAPSQGMAPDGGVTPDAGR